MPRPVTRPTLAFHAGVSGTPPSSWARASRAPRPITPIHTAAATRARTCFALPCFDTVAMLPQFYRAGDSEALRRTLGQTQRFSSLRGAGLVPGLDVREIFLGHAVAAASGGAAAAERHGARLDRRDHAILEVDGILQ